MCLCLLGNREAELRHDKVTSQQTKVLFSQPIMGLCERAFRGNENSHLGEI